MHVACMRNATFLSKWRYHLSILKIQMWPCSYTYSSTVTTTHITLPTYSTLKMDFEYTSITSSCYIIYSKPSVIQPYYLLLFVSWWWVQTCSCNERGVHVRWNQKMRLRVKNLILRYLPDLSYFAVNESDGAISKLQKCFKFLKHRYENFRYFWSLKYWWNKKMRLSISYNNHLRAMCSFVQCAPLSINTYGGTEMLVPWQVW